MLPRNRVKCWDRAGDQGWALTTSPLGLEAFWLTADSWLSKAVWQPPVVDERP